MVDNNIPDYMRGFDLNEDFGFTPVTSKPTTETPSIDPKVIETNNVELSKIKVDVSSIKSMMNEIMEIVNEKETITKDKLKYILLSDSNADFMKSLGIAYEIPDGLKKQLKTVLHGVKNDFLPVPSLFIINDKNEIEFEYISPDYKTRISNELLIAVATALKK